MEYTENILVCGHRGDRVWGRENTMGAFRMAVEAGVDMLETDVRMTADGALVLMHDETVDRTTDGTGLVCDLTLEQIQNLNAAVHSPFAAEPPATLEELLDLAKAHPKLLLNIELKDYPTEGNEAFAYECCDRIAKSLKNSGMGHRIWINSFDGRLLERIWKQYGKTFHYHGFYPWFILGPMETDPESFIDVACMQHRYQLPDGSVHKYEEPLCPKDWFDYLLQRGIMPLMAPSLREYPKYDLAFSWGSRIVNPDDPYTMLRHLRQMGKHS
jgi:glycerophosphoryl diester phosphodiesterase